MRNKIWSLAAAIGIAPLGLGLLTACRADVSSAPPLELSSAEPSLLYFYTDN
jgi:hypothetical protein